MSDPILDGHWRLACAILVLALKDARAGLKWNKDCGLPPGVNPGDDARAFLSSGGAAYLVGLLDLDLARLGRMVDGEWPEIVSGGGVSGG